MELSANFLGFEIDYFSSLTIPQDSKYKRHVGASQKISIRDFAPSSQIIELILKMVGEPPSKTKSEE